MPMLSFLSVALLIYGAMHLYVLGKVWLAFPHSLGLALVLILLGIALTFSPLLIHFLERQGWHRAAVASAWVSYTWMGYLFLFFCVGLLFDFGHVLAMLLNFNWPGDAMAFRAVGLLAFALLGYGFVEARQIRVETLNITTPKLAAGRVTIAQISDLHLGIMRGDALLDQVVVRLRALKPDIVVATGDMIDMQGDDFAEFARRFHAYTPPLGAYAVTGNHEYYAGLGNSLRFLRDAGFTVLRGETARAGGIVLVGVDDPSVASSGRQASTESRKALASLAANNFIVLLKHQPVVSSDIPFDLQLSGHIHGGQIFPFVYLTRMIYHVYTGLTQLADGRQLYVSRGTGTWGPPIRLFAPPEITLITIAKEH
jgi:uncharacterized protein